MRRLFSALLIVLLATAAPAWAQSVVSTDNVRAELISESSAIKAGEPFWVALRQTIKPHWHTYWKNPGDSGLPTEISWSLPAGTRAGPIVWPTPIFIDVGGIVNYGFEGDAFLLVKITPPADAAGTFHLAANVNWLVCSDVCIPEEAKFALDLPVAAAAAPADANTRALFEKARRDVPMESPWPARFGIAKTSGDPTLLVEAKGLKAGTISDIYFFPADWGGVANMAKENAAVSAEGIRIPLKKGDAKSGVPQQFSGTLVLTEKTGDGAFERHAFDVTAKLDPALASAGAALDASGSEAPLSFASALLFALLGGLILNLMPCVFPVLAMKAASFARLAGHARSEMRRDGLAYTAGVLVSFAAMAAVILSIRASVGEVSWGFQFQSPIFSLLVAYLFFVIGLNLSGMFEIGGGFTGIGQGLAARGGTVGAFFTGVLAVVVATPCTAPFMAAALGFALSQPAPQTVAVLLAMGLGLALPFLMLSMVPALQRLMPRPGAWMDRLRQFLAFPMYASAVWMVWVLTQQTGADGVIYALGGMILIAFAIWLMRTGSAGTLGTWLRRGLAAVAVLLALAAVLKIEDGPATAASASLSGPPAGVSFEGWERFTRARMAEAVAAKKPVFVDFTAAWCITCLVNERVALETPDTRRAFEQTGTVKLKGDWTNRDSEITGLLKELGRAGVPLYLYWAPGAEKPVILPQLLTEATIVAQLTGK
jgi:thiol:disulfide interchange protein